MSKSTLEKRRSLSRLGAVLLTAIAAAGCSPTAEPQGLWGKLWSLEVGPDYRRPELKPVDGIPIADRAG